MYKHSHKGAKTVNMSYYYHNYSVTWYGVKDFLFQNK